MNESTSNVKYVAQNDFTNVVTHSSQPVVADFYAPWCATCKALAPQLEHLAGSYTNKIKFVKINVDESPQLARSLHIEVPAVLFFTNGVLADRMAVLPVVTELTNRRIFVSPGGTDLTDKLDALAAGK